MVRCKYLFEFINRNSLNCSMYVYNKERRFRKLVEVGAKFVVLACNIRWLNY